MTSETANVAGQLNRSLAATAARDTLHRFVSVLYVLLPSGVDDQHAGEIIFATPKADGVFGYLPGELATKHINDLIPARFRNAHGSHLMRFSIDPHPRPMGGKNMRLVGLHKNGTEFPLQIELDAFVSETGLRCGVAVIARSSDG